MFKRISILIAAAVLSACTTVNNIPLSREASAQLQGKKLVRTQYPMPDFAAFTAGKAAFALLGAAAMIAEGNSIVKENAIPDPAIAIGEQLATRLAAARGVVAVPSRAVAASDDVAALTVAYPGADYVLDVKTFNWSFVYYPSNWARYRVIYSARLRLIDSASKKVVAETLCSTTQGDDANPPSKDDLLNNQAALLKQYLAKGATTCADLLAKDILML